MSAEVIRLKDELNQGFQTAFVDARVNSSLAYRPEFVSNNYAEGKKVLTSLEDELRTCDAFFFSVAFITSSGITPLLQIFQELEKKGVPGRILTTDYLNFTEPRALLKLQELSNIELKMYVTHGELEDPFDASTGQGGVYEGFHTKGYIFKNGAIYRIIVGSSNMTQAALTKNKEWNTRIVSTAEGEYAQRVLQEYEDLWNAPQALPFSVFYEDYKRKYDEFKTRNEIIRAQKKLALDEGRESKIVDADQYRLQPNSMQVAFVNNLQKLLEAGEDRALLISSTGTGKTLASAFAMRELGVAKVLFLVHRGQIAKQAREAYHRVFGSTRSSALLTGGLSREEQDEVLRCDYIFSTIQTFSKDEVMRRFAPDHFDAVVYDEAHHSSADTYQKVMDYLRPRLTLGMTATPDRRNDNLEGQNIYEIYNHNIAYEIRLQQAMEEDLLCPFHYFGITDLQVEGTISGDQELQNFRYLTSDARVSYVMKQANYYGYSGDRVKGLIFVSRREEGAELSRKFNEAGWRTKLLTGEDPQRERDAAIERLVMPGGASSDGAGSTGVMPGGGARDGAGTTGVLPGGASVVEADKGDAGPLDYIITVDLFSEGVDVPEINQVIMLRPTQSPIVFIQQLGRGLRKSDGKEYVVVLDFIGNYRNNFMIPVALSGDRTYNADTIRRYVISGNRVIPGASTIHFDEISRERIFHAIDHIRGIKDIIKQSYISLKNRLGRIPYLKDFYDSGEVDPMLIAQEYKTFDAFARAVDREYAVQLTEKQQVILEYYSKTILSGTRDHELAILSELLEHHGIVHHAVPDETVTLSSCQLSKTEYEDAIRVLQGHFVSKEDEYTKKYHQVDLVQYDCESTRLHLNAYAERFAEAMEVRDQEFYRQLQDIVSVGLARYRDKYSQHHEVGTPFVLYEKYSRRDISLLMHCGKDMSSTMFGMQRIGDDVFVFITYHKQEAVDADQNYLQGKPDYADEFDDNQTFRWDSQIGKGPESSYVTNVTTAPRKHLFVKKSDNEHAFYYMGEFSVDSFWGAEKENNRHKMQAITKFRFRMKHPVREDLLQYFESAMLE